MTTETPHHGFRVTQADTVYSPLDTTETSTIGLAYTAPNADPDIYPVGVPTLFLPDRYRASDLGSAGTGRDVLNAIWRHIGVPVVGVRLADAQTQDQMLANAVGAYTARSGVNAFYRAKGRLAKVPKILIAPGLTHQRVTGGVTQIQPGTGGAGYTYARAVFNANGYGGGARARATIVNGVITGWIMENCGIGYSEQHLAITIDGDGENATIAGFQLGTVANPVVAEMGAIGNRLRATIIADAPNSDAEASVAYRRDWATERILVVDNWPVVEDVDTASAITAPPSAYIAGLLAKVDNDEGFWVSPSNHVVQGVLGTARDIDDSGPGGELDYLNMTADVAAIVRRAEGFKLMGNHGCSPETLWRMFAVGRTRDTLYDTIERGCDAWATDRPLNLAFYEAVADAVNEKIRYWTAIPNGPLIGGRVWVDPALNPPGQLVLGKPKFSMSFEPTGVAEDIQVIAAREPGYYADLINQVVLALG